MNTCKFIMQCKCSMVSLFIFPLWLFVCTVNFLFYFLKFSDVGVSDGDDGNIDDGKKQLWWKGKWNEMDGRIYVYEDK